MEETNRYNQYLKETFPLFSPCWLTGLIQPRMRLSFPLHDGFYVTCKTNRTNDSWTMDDMFEMKIFGKLMPHDRFLRELFSFLTIKKS